MSILIDNRQWNSGVDWILSIFEYLGIFFRSDAESQRKQLVSYFLLGIMGIILSFDWTFSGIKCNTPCFFEKQLSAHFADFLATPWEKESPVFSCGKPWNCILTSISLCHQRFCPVDCPLFLYMCWVRAVLTQVEFLLRSNFQSSQNIFEHWIYE